MLRVVLVILVLAGFLVMYSIIRESPDRDLPNYRDAVRKRKEMDKRNRMIKKNIDKLKRALADNSEDDEPGEAATFTEQPKNVLGADVPPGRGRAFDEKHIDVVRQMVLVGRQNKYPDEGIHPFHGVHEDDLDNEIRAHKNEHVDKVRN